MEISILGTDGDFVVWVALHHGHPHWIQESFVIGGGETKAEAIDEALKSLRAAMETLEAAKTPEKATR